MFTINKIDLAFSDIADGTTRPNSVKIHEGHHRDHNSKPVVCQPTDMYKKLFPLLSMSAKKDWCNRNCNNTTNHGKQCPWAFCVCT